MRSKKIFTILFIILALLIVLRIALPYILLHYVEKQINKIPQYRAKIADLDVHLFRGAYTIKDIQLWKLNNRVPVPFFAAKTMDFSIEWRNILRGKIVAKIGIQEPNIHFVTDPSGKNEQLSISDQWLDVVKSLYPANINRLDVYNGKVNFSSFNGNPPFTIYIKNVRFTMENMQKAINSDEVLSSSFKFSADVIGGGTVDIYGKYDPLNKQPTFELKTQLSGLKIPQIASFIKHYSKVDVQNGTFSLYGEIAAAKGKITGYLKPFIKDLKIGGAKNPISAVVNTAASVVSKIIENPKQKTIATKVNLSGNVDDSDVSILSILGYFVRHGFIQALLPKIDNSVKMTDVVYGKQNPNDKFPTFK